MTKKELISEIQKGQVNRTLNDSQLAEFLGIDPTLWSRLKTGERNPSITVLKTIMGKMPELQLAVMAYLADPITAK